MTLNRRSVVIAALGVLLAGGWLAKAQELRGQSSQTASRKKYAYVGVEQSIARIDEATGRIEILFQKRSGRASLLVDQRDPWYWRPVRIQESDESAVPHVPSGGVSIDTGRPRP